MSSPFAPHVLIPKVDPQNPESILRMWMVFSKCAELVEEGKRLENLAWRLWNQESFRCQSRQDLSTTRNIEVHARPPSLHEVPSLSASVDSAASAASEDTKRITSEKLEKMILKIMETTDLKPPALNVATSLPDIADPASGSTSCLSSQLSTGEHDALTPESDCSTIIVYGFSPSSRCASSGPKLEPSQRLAAPSQPQQKSQYKARKQGDMFTPGGSIRQEANLFKKGISCQPKPSSSFKANQPEMPEKPSGKEIAQSRQIGERDAKNESEREDVWEDSGSERESAVPTFRRVESTGQETPPRSKLTMQLRKSSGAAALVNEASRGSSWLRRSHTSSCGSPALGLYNGNKKVRILTVRGPKSHRALSIYPRPGTHPQVNSPRTVRRNMLANELTESLRKHLLWESNEKRKTAYAVLKHRHTTPILNSPNCCAQQTDTKTILSAKCPLADVPGSVCEAPSSRHHHLADVCKLSSATETWPPHNTNEDLNLDSSDYHWVGW